MTRRRRTTAALLVSIAVVAATSGRSEVASSPSFALDQFSSTAGGGLELEDGAGNLRARLALGSQPSGRSVGSTSGIQLELGPWTVLAVPEPRPALCGLLVATGLAALRACRRGHGAEAGTVC